MNPDSENFDSLRRLLAIKRHEQPPPGYFNRFPRDVMARIKAGESGDKIATELPWVQRFLGMFELKPVFAGAFGMGICALVISGVVSSDIVSGPAVAVGGSDSSQSSIVADNFSPSVAATPVVLTDSNASPVTTSLSLFQQYQPQIRTERVSGTPEYWIRNGNN